jgi:hypothetical protein
MILSLLKAICLILNTFKMLIYYVFPCEVYPINMGY